jgi:hypothetical protein
LLTFVFQEQHSLACHSLQLSLFLPFALSHLDALLDQHCPLADRDVLLHDPRKGYFVRVESVVREGLIEEEVIAGDTVLVGYWDMGSPSSVIIVNANAAE